ncbi:glycosyltransferase family 9 protein [Brevundimonas faecalis]|uniref:Heptosyltransferase-3 n=1 Tax=Brevundimonas faecalis TaxID=947378 RepID=A0ABV2RBT5_9CAUL
MSDGAPQVLFVTSDRIGDCVMSSGAIREIGRQVPGAEITVACGPTAAALFRAAPGVIKVIPWRKQKAAGHWRALWRATVGTRWAMTVDVRGSGLAYLLRTGERRIYNRSWETGLAKVETFSRMMKAERTMEPEIFLDDQARSEAAAVIGDHSAPVLALAPISTAADRSWPAERWGVLVERLKAEPRFDGWRFMLVGGPGDQPAAAPALAAAGERGIDCVGRGDILASAAAIARSALFVGNDSGLMHVAAATGTPTLGLFGPSEWWHKAPWGAKGRVLASSPTRGEFRPITDLTVERVFESVLALHDAFIGGANPDQP